MLNDRVEARRMAQIERRLNELGSLTKGNQNFQADRLSDVLDQIDELRKEVTSIGERVDRMAAFLNDWKQKNGG